MSAFRGAKNFGRRRDLPLIAMVEEYLIANKEQHYINLEDMGDAIRKKSFRFSRMKQAVFREQLKNAYDEYTEARTKELEEWDNEDHEQEEVVYDEEHWNMQTDDGNSKQDDEISILENSTSVVNDAGANQMKNLYKPPSAADEVAVNQSVTTGPSRAMGNPETIETPSKTSSNSLSGKQERPACPPPIQAMNSGDESGSDLEIIEEVNDNRGAFRQHPSVIVGTPGEQRVVTGSGRFIPGAGQVLNTARNDNCNPRTNLMVNGQKPTPGSHPLNKGVKRKIAKTGDESSTGINEDYTRKRSKKEVAVIRDSGYKLKDFAGSEKIVEEICKLLMHLKHPEVYHTLGVTPPRGFLLHGPPGTGKTLLANAIAGELELPMLKIAGTELVSGISGESESNIRELFNQAVAVAPCIIFIDEIDSVTPKRDNVNKEMERRIVAQLLSCIDDLINKEKGDQVLLIGATNRVEAIDTALRRAGRFDREICLGIPDEKSRETILSVICRGLRLESGFKIDALARLTPGFVGADLQALVREAAVQAVNRKILLGNKQSSKEVKTGTAVSQTEKMEGINCTAADQLGEKNPPEQAGVNPEDAKSDDSDDTDFDEKKALDSESASLAWIKESSPLSQDELNDLFITMKDFEFALKSVQPSSKREGFATVPDTTWDDIGALKEIRDELQVSILGPVKHAEAFSKLGLTTPAGVLLCGPPGCGKTLLAKAVANEAGINFISVKGPELLNMYVGESERAVRQCFLRARNSSPCVIFFDELDALCPRRSDIADGGSGGRIVNQLLTEMDGIESRQGVFVMAATNRPDIIDPAVLRPGRLDKILFVNLPTPQDRHEILKAITKNSTKPTLAEDVNLEEIAMSPECEDYTGADLSALVREASIAAFRELVLENKDNPSTDLKVHSRHFKTAFMKTKPSVGKEDRLKYKGMAEKYSSIR